MALGNPLLAALAIVADAVFRGRSVRLRTLQRRLEIAAPASSR